MAKILYLVYSYCKFVLTILNWSQYSELITIKTWDLSKMIGQSIWNCSLIVLLNLFILWNRVLWENNWIKLKNLSYWLKINFTLRLMRINWTQNTSAKTLNLYWKCQYASKEVFVSWQIISWNSFWNFRSTSCFTNLESKYLLSTKWRVKTISS